MSISVEGWDFDVHNKEELWRHRISDADVLAVAESDRVLFLRNKGNRAGVYRMIGRDDKGRLLTVVIMPSPLGKRVWRAITGWRSTAGEERQWRNS